MKKDDDFLQNFVNLSTGEKITIGRSALSELATCFEKGGLDDETITMFILSTLSIFVSADNTCTYEEYEMFKELTNYNIEEEDFYTLCKRGREPEMVESFNQMFHNLSNDDKWNILLVGLSIISSDNEINIEEQQLLKKLIS